MTIPAIFTKYFGMTEHTDDIYNFSDDEVQARYRAEILDMDFDRRIDDLIMEDLLRSSNYPHLSSEDWSIINSMPKHPLSTQVSWLRGFREGLSLEDSRTTYPEDFL